MSDVIWQPVPSCPGHEASSDGQIRAYSPRWRRTYVKKQSVGKAGYLVFWRLDGEKQRERFVHSAVAEAFHGPRPDGAVTRHLNGNPLDNRVENLAWGTPSENVLDAIRHGTHPQASKTHCPSNHPYDEANTYWLRGGRYCRACNRAAAARTKARKRVAAVTA